MRSLRDMGHRYQQGPAVSIVRADTCLEAQCAAPLLHQLPTGGGAEHGPGGAGGGKQPPNDLRTLPGAGPGNGCGKVVWHHAGQRRGGEGGPGKRAGGEDCGAAEIGGGVIGQL